MISCAVIDLFVSVKKLIAGDGEALSFVLGAGSGVGGPPCGQ